MSPPRPTPSSPPIPAPARPGRPPFSPPAPPWVSSFGADQSRSSRYGPVIGMVNDRWISIPLSGRHHRALCGGRAAGATGRARRGTAAVRVLPADPHLVYLQFVVELRQAGGGPVAGDRQPDDAGLVHVEFDELHRAGAGHRGTADHRGLGDPVGTHVHPVPLDPR